MDSVVAKRPATKPAAPRPQKPRSSVRSMQSEVLEAIASGQRLDRVAELLCRWIERLAPRAVCSIMILDSEGLLQPLAGPNLPAESIELARDLPVGPDVGTCGRAAYLGIPIQTVDIATDPCWDGYRALPLQIGLRACWSSPIHGKTGRVIGTFALYFRSCRGPSPAEARFVLESVRLCALAIDHEAVLVRLEQVNQRLDAALGNVRQGVCFYDGKQRLIMANSRYSEIYDVPPGLIQPGISLQAVVDLRIAAGSGPQMEHHKYLNWREVVQANQQAINTTVELSSGKVISMHHQPMPNGGWVSTHEDVTERHRAEARIVHMATHDPLTGLPNRNVFRDRIEKAVAHRPNRRTCAVICIDLDQFKSVNDTFGHPVGDALLIAAAKRLRSCVRSVDTVTRLGGDEFAILLPSIERRERAGHLAARIVEKIIQPYELGEHRLRVGASLGIATAPTDGGTAEELMKHADVALYRAKLDGGGSTWRFFEPGMTPGPAGGR